MYGYTTEETIAAVHDPLPGDEYDEFLSYWRVVVCRDGDFVATLECHGGCTLPRDGKLWTGTVAEFVASMTYETNRERSFMHLCKRGLNVDGWYSRDKRDEAKAERDELRKRELGILHSDGWRSVRGRGALGRVWRNREVGRRSHKTALDLADPFGHMRYAAKRAIHAARTGGAS